MNIIVVADGQVGEVLARQLGAQGHRVTLVLAGVAEVDGGEPLPGGRALAGDGSDPAVLESAGARGADVVAAVTGADATNLVVASLARLEFGVPRTVACCVDPRAAWLFTREMGVDVVVGAADVVARQLAGAALG